MFRIAVCDDTTEIRQLLRQYFQRLQAETSFQLTLDEYASGEALLQADPSTYDLLILDVQMEGLNGIDTARRIRQSGGQMTIIFFTNYVQYAMEGYEVQAYRFLLKPLSYEQFSNVVGTAMRQMQEQKQESLHIRQKDSVTRIAVADIAFVETERGHVVIHTKEKEAIPSSMTMKEMEEALSGHRFFRCHTAYLVNMREIKKFTQQDVVLQDDTVIPLSKHRRKEMKEALALYWGEQFL
ncbi:MAG: response regulator transcription factor [Clostridia bacterium]|nr:response regulator transcription factor [Clostridia bacterium]